MTVYAWPQTDGWVPVRFEMRVVHNDIIFTSQYSKSTQATDLLGERWHIVMELPAGGYNDAALGAAKEAFSDRLRGRVNLISIGYQQRRVPYGTLRDGNQVANWINASSAAATWVNASSGAASWSAGAPALRYAIAQLGNLAYIQSVPGATLKAGDHLGLGQLVRVLADTSPAGSDGLIVAEFTPRARRAIPAYTAVQWAYPTANFRQVSDGIPVQWHPGMHQGSAIELIEDI